MIHDIDVIASLVHSTVDRVEAVGVAVLTDKPDIANAQITFSNGCIANVTASRVSIKRERRSGSFNRTLIFPSTMISGGRKLSQTAPAEVGSTFGAETIEIKEGDALADEIDSFLDCVRTRSLPLVSGAEGTALEIASMISGNYKMLFIIRFQMAAQSKQVMLVVGEASGDIHRAHLVRASARTKRCDFLALVVSN